MRRCADMVMSNVSPIPRRQPLNRLLSQLTGSAARLLVLAACLAGCSFSYTGAALDPEIKTFSVETFQNNSGLGPASLAQTFTEELRTFIQRNANLRLNPNNDGDVQYSGVITGFTVQPVNATAQGGVEAAGANRLTITVQVHYVNTKDPKQNFDQAFSYYDDFDRNLNVDQLSDSFIRGITNRLYLDIFTRSLANW